MSSSSDLNNCFGYRVCETERQEKDEAEVWDQLVRAIMGSDTISRFLNVYNLLNNEEYYNTYISISLNGMK